MLIMCIHAHVSVWSLLSRAYAIIHVCRVSCACYNRCVLLSLKVSIYFGAWFICSLAGASWYSAVGFQLGTVALSGLFTYEVCRKLDPTLPKVWHKSEEGGEVWSSALKWKYFVVLELCCVYEFKYVCAHNTQSNIPVVQWCRISSTVVQD